MKKKDFIKMMDEEDEDWEPGRDAIDAEFSRIYPNQEPIINEIPIANRKEFGGSNYLDEFDIYRSKKDYNHIVTLGMSQLEADPNYFGKEYSKWGYEMTFKINNNDYLWALDILSSLASFTNIKKRKFTIHDIIPFGGKSLNPNIDSKITALIIIKDTDVKTINTYFGKVDFLQLYGITEKELTILENNPEKITEFINLVKKDNPDFITDMNRTKSYLEEDYNE